MKLFLDEGKTIAEGALFLIALPSFANVGQLAIDATISTLGTRVERVGCIESADVLPVTGYDCMFPGSKPTLCMPIEVYHITERNIYIIQQRSPTVLGKQCSFSNSLHDLLTSLQYATALLITGASREEVEIAGGGLFHIASPDARKAIETEYPLFIDVLSNKTKAMASSVSDSFIPYGMALSSLLWRASATSFIPLAPAGGESLMDPMMVHASDSVFTGTSKAAAVAAEGIDIASVVEQQPADLPVSNKTIVFGKLCNEGNNAMDGVEVALVLLNSLALKGAEPVHMGSIVTPLSWQRVFGKALTEESMFY